MDWKSKISADIESFQDEWKKMCLSIDTKENRSFRSNELEKDLQSILSVPVVEKIKKLAHKLALCNSREEEKIVKDELYSLIPRDFYQPIQEDENTTKRKDGKIVWKNKRTPKEIPIRKKTLHNYILLESREKLGGFIRSKVSRLLPYAIDTRYKDIYFELKYENSKCERCDNALYANISPTAYNHFEANCKTCKRKSYSWHSECPCMWCKKEDAHHQNQWKEYLLQQFSSFHNYVISEYSTSYKINSEKFFIWVANLGRSKDHFDPFSFQEKSLRYSFNFSYVERHYHCRVNNDEIDLFLHISHVEKIQKIMQSVSNKTMNPSFRRNFHSLDEIKKEKKQVARSVSNKMRITVFRRDNFSCQICGRNPPNHGVTIEVDHIFPISKGGENDIGNLETLCQDCNRGKSASVLWEGSCENH